jgi:hypothetical protein
MELHELSFMFFVIRYLDTVTKQPSQKRLTIEQKWPKSSHSYYYNVHLHASIYRITCSIAL